MSPELEIRQHNALTNARYDYTELQLDVLFFLISRLRKEQKSSVYELSIKELSALTGKKYDYPYLRKATADMGSRMFEVETKRGYQQMWMFQHVLYVTGQGIIEIKLSEAVLPFLFDLKDNFTSYGLAAALRLGSKYAKRIYQLCSQWKDLGETKKYDLQDFKKRLGLLDEKGNEKMKQVGELRSYVLDPAVKQINEHTELHISYTLGKKGRAFKNIVFTVGPQVLAETIPFDLVPSGTAPVGMQQHQVENAGRLLAQLSITTPDLVAQILANPAHIVACNKFAHDLKTGKYTKSHSLSGLLLTVLGIKKVSNGPLLADRQKKKI